MTLGPKTRSSDAPSLHLFTLTGPMALENRCKKCFVTLILGSVVRIPVIHVCALMKLYLFIRGSKETEISCSSNSYFLCFVLHYLVKALSCTDGVTSGPARKSIQVKDGVPPPSLWGQDSEIPMATFLEIVRLWSGTKIQLAKPNPANMWEQRAVGNALIQEQLLAPLLLLQSKVLGLAAPRLEKL